MAATRSGGGAGVLRRDDLREYRRRLDKLREIMRSNALDAVVIGSDDSGSDVDHATSWAPEGPPRYARYISGFRVSTMGTKDVVVVVPLSGGPTLIVPPGFFRGWQRFARSVSWIGNVLTSYREGDTRGLYGMKDDSSALVARVIHESGLGKATIGVVNSWRGIEKTKALMPTARFEPTLTVGPNGDRHDMLASLIQSSSTWEIRRFESMQSAAEAVMRAFIGAAKVGRKLRDATAKATYTATLRGAEKVKFVTNVGTDEWSIGMTPDQVPGARYRRGDLVVCQIELWMDGYSLQFGRTWVLGRPTAVQEALIKTARTAMNAMIARAEIGVTGGELYETGMAAIREGGFLPWGTLGHVDGFEHGVLLPGERIAIMPGNRVSLADGSMFVVHGSAFDVASGYAALVTEPVVIERGHRRLLSRRPLTYASSFDASRRVRRRATS